jgi:1,4-alpha-glucan branching enzyme
MEHITGPQWWTDYQPVSYKIYSKRGNRAQFQSMVEDCHKAGLKVIVDVIFNHMAGSNDGTGVAGSTYSEHYIYPGIYGYNVSQFSGLSAVFEDSKFIWLPYNLASSELSSLQ